MSEKHYVGFWVCVLAETREAGHLMDARQECTLTFPLGEWQSFYFRLAGGRDVGDFWGVPALLHAHEGQLTKA